MAQPTVRHDLPDDIEPTATLCGLDIFDLDGHQTVDLSCACKHPLCKYPVSCPCCKQIASGTVS